MPALFHAYAYSGAANAVGWRLASATRTRYERWRIFNSVAMVMPVTMAMDMALAVAVAVVVGVKVGSC